MSRELSEQEIVRREALQEIRNLGIDPYPAEEFKVNAFASKIQDTFKEGMEDRFQDVRLAGRLMVMRGKGKVIFAEIQDATERIQIYLKRDILCPDEDKSYYNEFIKKLLDIGDYIGVIGSVFQTNKGETTIRVEKLTLLSKALRPLPIVKVDSEGNTHDAFTNPELRYRMRYVDLTVNPQYREVFRKRAKVISTMRTYFDRFGWLEVETPILQPIHGGAAARPFATHHNTLDMPLYLRIANELYLKRLIIGGFDGVYEIGKMFRNEGMDRTHNPEFTSMEIYVAYKDYTWMMKMVEDLLEYIAKVITDVAQVKIGNKIIDFKGPYKRLSMYEAIEEHVGTDVSEMDETELRKFCKEQKILLEENMNKGKIIDEIFSEKVEHHLHQPTFIIDYPIEMTPLAKKHRSKDGLVERFELFVNGKEIANAYTELNDPIDQKERFLEQLQLADRGDEEAMAMDEDFIRAMEFGMPPMTGLGIGIDRLVMLLTNQTSIQEVLFFPQMRMQNK